MARSLLSGTTIAFTPLLALLACGSNDAVIASTNSPPAGDAAGVDALETRAPDAGPTDPCALAPLRKVLWGDIHVHTSYSIDSYSGDNRNDPVSAYAFARKQGTLAIANDPTHRIAIDRPLDFAVITDHSEFLDVMEQCTLDPSSPSYPTDYCSKFRENGAASTTFISRMAQLLRVNPTEPEICDGAQGNVQCQASRRSAWQRLQAAAKSATQSDCSFTGIIGYEWTASTGGNNLHRNVVFANDEVTAQPLDYIHYPTVQALWSGLDAQCTGNCRALVLPHNSNASGGKMWDEAASVENHAAMIKYQRSVEVYQHKGSSECFPDATGLSDPECAFETQGGFLSGDEPPDPSTRPGFIREALGRGLEIVHGADAGANPLALGFIGATDTHNGAPGYVTEGTDDGPKWQGHVAAADDTPAERVENNAGYSPGSITGVWARNNTRGEIFAALDRRETYATSGPRLTVRFYAKTGIPSQEAADAYCADPDFPAKLEAARAVPMGDNLATGSEEPWLFVMAAKDATDLDLVDFITLRTGADGKATMARIEVPLREDQRSVACVARKLPALTGASRGLAYARVFEKPTWRWSHYDCLDPSVASLPECDPVAGSLNVKIRERAWTSPIFFR